MKLKVIRKYHDLELKKVLSEGAELEVTRQRAEELLRLGLVREIKENHVKSGPEK